MTPSKKKTPKPKTTLPAVNPAGSPSILTDLHSGTSSTAIRKIIDHDAVVDEAVSEALSVKEISGSVSFKSHTLPDVSGVSVSKSPISFGLSKYNTRVKITNQAVIHTTHKFKRGAISFTKGHGPSIPPETEAWIRTHILDRFSSFIVKKPVNTITGSQSDLDLVHDVTAYPRFQSINHLFIDGPTSLASSALYSEGSNDLNLDNALMGVFNNFFLISKQDMFRHQIPTNWRSIAFNNPHIKSEIVHIGNGWLYPHVTTADLKRDVIIQFFRIATDILTIEIANSTYPSLMVFTRSM